MNRSLRKIMAIKHRLNSGIEYNEIGDMFESGMEENEIASELGLSPDYLKDMNDETIKDR